MLYEKKVFSKGLKAKQKATDVRIYIKKDEIASVSKRIVEYDRFIRSASHVNIYALLVFFSRLSFHSFDICFGLCHTLVRFLLSMRSQLCIRYLIRIHVVGSVYMCAFLSLVFGWVSEWARESWFWIRCDTKYTVYSDTWIGEAF